MFPPPEIKGLGDGTSPFHPVFLKSSVKCNGFPQNACAALCGVRLKNAYIWAMERCDGHTAERWLQAPHAWTVVSGGIGAYIGTVWGGVSW